MIKFQNVKAEISAFKREDGQGSNRRLRRAVNGNEYVYHQLVEYHFDLCLECERQQVDLDLCLHAEDAARATRDG